MARYGATQTFGRGDRYGAETHRRGRIHQVWMELPGIERKGRIHQVWMELPEEARKGRIHQVWMELPGFDRAGRIHQVYMVLPTSEDEEEVVDFERLLRPIFARPFERLDGSKVSASHTGKLQLRPGYAAGFVWVEEYEARQLKDPVLVAFHEYLQDLKVKKRLFEITLPTIAHRPTLLGTATGTISVNGAGQTGDAIVTDGWTGTLKRGDLIRIDGLRYSMAVTADVTGPGTIGINPPILAGGSPADNAEVFYGANLRIRAVVRDVHLPEAAMDRTWNGMTVEFQEAP